MILALCLLLPLALSFCNGEGDIREQLRADAEQGNAEAQYNLGTLYKRGNGDDISQDYQESLRWYHLASEQGHARAQALLGTMYYEGNGTPQDYQQALRWYRKAALQGDVEAQFNLGVMYDGGYGIEQDLVLAHMWMDLASSGDKEAEVMRDTLKARMTEQQLAESKQWVAIAAESIAAESIAQGH